MDGRRALQPQATLLQRWRRHLRHGCDAGSASMVSYVVAASFFVLGSSFLLGFVVESPATNTAAFDQATLKSQGQNALAVLLGTPGYPATWAGTQADVDGVKRLGLIDGGSNVRIDPTKFSALARGRYATSSTTNGFVDYVEAKKGLGLDGYEFHLRAYPLLSPGDDGMYGTSGMDDFRVAYVGNIPASLSWSVPAQREADAIEALGVGFNKQLRSQSLTGDVYRDASSDLRANLLPNIGASIQQTELAAGAGLKYSFHRVPASAYSSYASPGDLGALNTQAMALSYEGELGYIKSRELRAIVGSASLGAAQTAELTWREWVDSDKGTGNYDCGDYGFVEYSMDEGATWTPVKKLDAITGLGPTAVSVDCLDAAAGHTPHVAAMTARAETLNCGGPCGTILLAFHWVADNDNRVGRGWVVDDVVLTAATGQMRKTFEKPEYGMLILGSELNHQAFTPDDVKDAIRDYVDKYEGRLLVLGGQGNIEWLDRLFDVGLGGGAGGISIPDTTHPLLTLPNPLSVDTYGAPATVYTVGQDDASLFNLVISSNGGGHILSVAREGAWGTGQTRDGSVILSSYRPYQFSDVELRRFLANGVVYGKYHYLYLEVGPPIPENEPVSSAMRTGTMNKYREGTPEHVEMAFVIYVWPGSSNAQAVGAAGVQPVPPANLQATSAPNQVTLTWTPPDSWGSGEPDSYRIFRSTSPHPTTLLATLPHDAPPIFVDSLANDPADGARDGVTYYYVVRAWTGVGPSGPSNQVSATPMSPPGAPVDFDADPGLGHIKLTWEPPASTGGGTILGYRLYVDNESDGTFELLAEVGNALQYDHALPHTDPVDFRLTAVNGYSEGPATATVTGQALPPVLPPTVVATQGAAPKSIVLTLVAPGELHGYTPQGWRLYRSATQEGGYALLAEIPAANNSFDDREVGSGETWWYRLTLLTEVGETLQSEASGATTIAPPAAPVLTAQTVAGTTTLTWTVPASAAPITHYQVYKGASALSTPTLVDEPAVNADTDAFDPAKPFYRVRAVSGAGEGDFSSGVDASALPVSAPTLVVSGLVAPNNLTLQWTEPTELHAQTITNYRIFRSATSGGTYTQLAEIGTNRSYEDRDLGASATWYYAVAAVTEDTQGLMSNSASGTTMAVPGAPVVTATRLLGTATIVWTVPASAAQIVRYDLYKGATADTASEFVKSVAADLTTTQDAYDSNKKFYRVRAVSAAGAGAWSNGDSAAV